MQKFDYLGMATTASRLINKFGKSILKRTVINSGSEFDPTQVNVDTPIDGVVVAYGLNEIDGSLILASDKKLLSASLVTVADKIVDGSIVYSVVSVTVVEPAYVTLIYKVQLRV